MKRLFVILSAFFGFFGTSFANEASEKLLAMTEEARNEALTELIKPSGETCDAVVRSMHLGNNPNGTGTWSVACRDKNEYILGLETGQKMYASVLRCADVKLLMRAIDPSKPAIDCWKK